MSTFLKIEEVTAALNKAFSRLETRLQDIHVNDGIATIIILTDHRGGRIGLDELLDLTKLLGLGPESLTLWDSRQNSVEIILDLEPTTPIERPR